MKISLQAEVSDTYLDIPHWRFLGNEKHIALIFMVFMMKHEKLRIAFKNTFENTKCFVKHGRKHWKTFH